MHAKDPESTQLPVLSVPNPCSESWNEMSGDRQKRFCLSCQKHVHNLSAMNLTDVRCLLDQEPSICIRMNVRQDGSLITTDSTLPVKSRRSWLKKIAGITAAIIPAISFLGCEPSTFKGGPVMGELPPPDSTSPAELMGKPNHEEVTGGKIIMGDIAASPTDADHPTHRPILGKAAQPQDDGSIDQAPSE